MSANGRPVFIAPFSKREIQKLQGLAVVRQPSQLVFVGSAGSLHLPLRQFASRPLELP
jgi:hypothetical protein